MTGSDAVSGTPALPACVQLVELPGRRIHLVPTAHVSRQSVEDVRDTIAAVRPDTVCVELCDGRFRNLMDREAWKKTDIVRVLRSGKAMLLLASLIMTSFQRRIAKQLGVMPGAEMVEGIRQAEATGARLVLADRDIQTTLRRSWGRFGLRDRFKMILSLITSLFAVEELDEKTIEEIKQQEKLSGMLEMLAQEFPSVKDTLVDERDVYLAQKIRDAGGESVVAVVGAAHVPGILREIHREHDLAPLERLPRPPFWPKLVAWGIPLAIVGLLLWELVSSGVAEFAHSLGIWVLVNGSLSALGAALALGHPLAIVTAFVAAPITSLNPTIAAGWFAGLAQAIARRPTVGDLEALPEAITSVKGFWTNPVTRVLIVTVLSNIGSMLGTFIAGGWIAGRTVS